MRILLVEDDRKVAGFIQQGLTREPYAVDVLPTMAPTPVTTQPPCLLPCPSVLEMLHERRDVGRG